ncbi:hypothetical protein BaRGS_00027946, partial [Batillaria attramentaria]
LVLLQWLRCAQPGRKGVRKECGEVKRWAGGLLLVTSGGEGCKNLTYWSCPNLRRMSMKPAAHGLVPKHCRSFSQTSLIGLKRLRAPGEMRTRFSGRKKKCDASEALETSEGSNCFV